MKCADCGGDATHRPDRMYAICWKCHCASYGKERYSKGWMQGFLIGVNTPILAGLIYFGLMML